MLLKIRERRLLFDQPLRTAGSGGPVLPGLAAIQPVAFISHGQKGHPLV